MSGNRARRRPRRGGFRRPRWRAYADAALTVALLAALAFAAAHVPRLWPVETLAGVVRVADGDSLVMRGVRIRLEGIDAPELAQSCTRGGIDYPCGREARDALVKMVAGRTVSCESARRDRYERVLARCVSGEVELNRAMVEAGWALAYGDYRAEERIARQAGRGMWAGSFERPQDWRRIHGGLAEDSHDGLSLIFGWLRGLFGP